MTRPTLATLTALCLWPTSHSADAAEPPAKKPAADRVVLVGGDRLIGHVTRIDGDKELRLTGPPFVGEVAVKAPTLDHVTMSPSRTDAGGVLVSVTNGDRVTGDLAAVTADAVVLLTPAAGRVTIPRRLIESVSAGGGHPFILLASRFDEGTIEPWATVGDGWQIADGALTFRSLPRRARQYPTVYAKLEQTEAITVELHVVDPIGRNLYPVLTVFAGGESPPTQNAANGIRFAYRGRGMWELQVADNRRARRLSGPPPPADWQQQRPTRLRFAYDPGTGKARVWINGKDRGQLDVPNQPRRGNYVALSARYPCAVRLFRVLHGVVPPSETLGSVRAARATKDADRVRFANGDSVAATAITMADGVFAIATSIGTLRVPADKVAHIAFRTAGRQRPRQRRGDVRVETTRGRYTFRLERLTEEHVVGTSDYLAAVKLHRDAVKRISFNIYGRPGPVMSPSADRAGAARRAR